MFVFIMVLVVLIMHVITLLVLLLVLLVEPSMLCLFSISMVTHRYFFFLENMPQTFIVAKNKTLSSHIIEHYPLVSSFFDILDQFVFISHIFNYFSAPFFLYFSQFSILMKYAHRKHTQLSIWFSKTMQNAQAKDVMRVTIGGQTEFITSRISEFCTESISYIIQNLITILIFQQNCVLFYTLISRSNQDSAYNSAIILRLIDEFYQQQKLFKQYNEITLQENVN